VWPLRILVDKPPRGVADSRQVSLSLVNLSLCQEFLVRKPRRTHAKTTWTVIFPRFNPAPVGRMDGTGFGPPGTAGRCSSYTA
jgi:hypothetical protein